MCPHNDFEIIYYEDYIMVRKCKGCGAIEVRSELRWHDVREMLDVLKDLGQTYESH